MTANYMDSTPGWRFASLKYRVAYVRLCGGEKFVGRGNDCVVHDRGEI